MHWAGIAKRPGDSGACDLSTTHAHGLGAFELLAVQLGSVVSIGYCVAVTNHVGHQQYG